MIKFSLMKIMNKFCTKPRYTSNLRDVLSLYDKEKFSEAYSALCVVMENQSQLSKDADLYLLRANLELRVNGDVIKARDLLDTAQKVGSFDKGYYYGTHSYLMWMSRKHEEAIYDMEKCIAENPSVSNLIIFGEILSFVGDKRAINIWQQVLEKDSNNCLAYINIGCEMAKSGDRQQALFMANKAKELRSSAKDAAGLGGLYHELEEFQSAINAYLEAEKLGYEEEGLLYAAVADCYSSLGQKAPARKYAQQAIRQDPENDYVKDVWREYQEKFGEAQ